MSTVLRPASRPTAPPSRRSSAASGRRPLRDNTRLLLVGIVVLFAALVGLLTLANRSATLAPDFLTEFVLYALSATNLTMLVVLVFVLARNIVKLIVERRRALPFARFRAKLVAVLLGMTLIPAVLVLIVGSELIRTSVDRWFNAPMDEVLSTANAIAGDYYQERQHLVSAQARQLADALAAIDLGPGNLQAVRDLIAPTVLQERARLVEVYRVTPGGSSQPAVVPVVEVAAPTLSLAYSRASADRLAERIAAGTGDSRVIERVAGGAELVRAAVPIRSAPKGAVRGVVIASDSLSGQFAARARQMTNAYEDYQQLRVLKQPLAGVYLSFFLTLTLMILVGATWMGLYLAKRITRPVQMLATAAKEIGAGHLDHRVIPETADEFGSLIDAFNSMAGELAVSRRRLERSAVDLERKHHDVEGRRRYVETILDRIATGVLSVDAAGRIGTVNSAAARMLGIDGSTPGLPMSAVLDRAELKPLAILLDEASRSRGARAEGRGVARGRQTAGARDQESAHPDSALRRAAPPALRGRAGSDPPARRRVHIDDRGRGRIAQGPGGRVLSIRPDARASGRCDRPAGAAHRSAGALQGHLHRGGDPAALRRTAADGLGRSGADSAGHHQPRRQRDRSDGPARRHRRRGASRSRQQSRPRRRGRRRPGDPSGRA